MSYFRRTIDNPLHQRELFDRLARLHPGQPALWGKMIASLEHCGRPLSSTVRQPNP